MPRTGPECTPSFTGRWSCTRRNFFLLPFFGTAKIGHTTSTFSGRTSSIAPIRSRCSTSASRNWRSSLVGMARC